MLQFPLTGYCILARPDPPYNPYFTIPLLLETLSTCYPRKPSRSADFLLNLTSDSSYRLETSKLTQSAALFSPTFLLFARI